jgi:hypothetical protein
MASIPGVSAFPESENLLNWVGTIQGPQGTVSRTCSINYKPPLAPKKRNAKTWLKPSSHWQIYSFTEHSSFSFILLTPSFSQKPPGLRRSHLQTWTQIPLKLPLLSPYDPFRHPHVPPQRRHPRQHLS